MSKHEDGFIHKIDKSAVFTVIGIIILFSTAVVVTLIAPRHIDSSWVQPTSAYQVQMYEVADPHIYISKQHSTSSGLQAVYHLERDVTLLGFSEAETVRIVSPKELEKYITHLNEPILKLTSRLLLLRKPIKGGLFDAVTAAENMRLELQQKWEKEHPKWEEEGLQKMAFEILELYEVPGRDAFALADTDKIVENWVDEKYHIVEGEEKAPWHKGPGVIYVHNPSEYRVKFFKFGKEEEWRYDPLGDPVASVQELESHPLGFRSRKELISYGEHLYAIEGCWYCHTDQTRTLVQDVVLNGSDSYPAPPSSANEYIYQKITFPGTRRIGPDMSRVGVKRPSRDWHKSHFWSPQTASKGSIMPAFRHFFDDDPRGTSKFEKGIPNHKFEAIFQYLMTKGTRITPPNEAWWLGKDPVMTKEIIEGRRRL